MRLYIKEIEYFIKKWYFVTFILLVTVLGFGFDLAHFTVNVDSLAGEIYNGPDGQMWASGRFGMLFWTLFFKGSTDLVENSFFAGAFGLFLLIWSAINFCILFKKASNNSISMPAFTVFAACLISFPLMNEIWKYYGANLTVCGGFLFVSFALLLVYNQIENRKFHFLSTLAICFFMTIVSASYESLLCVYVFAVFALLFLKESNNNAPKKHLKEGLIYTVPLILGLIFRFVIHNIILALINIEPAANGATEIKWFDGEGFIFNLCEMIISVAKEHFIFAPLYFPLALFVICLTVFWGILIFQIIKKRLFCALLIFGMIFSSELLSLVQGIASPYRTCQVFAILCAFVFLLTANKLRFKNTVPAVLALVCILQASFLNYTFTLNYIRYEQEKAVIQEIGTELEESFSKDKPVIFIGKLQLSNNINEKIAVKKESFGYKTAKTLNNICENFAVSLENAVNPRLEFPDTNVNSVINWSTNAFKSTEMLKELFEFHGFDINVYGTYSENLKFYRKNFKGSPLPQYPEKGYIKETEEVIFVKLGQIK